MADYDLVVIGATPAGVEAAIAAAHYHARVALVEQNSPVTASPFLPGQVLGEGLQQLAAWAQLDYLPLDFEGAQLYDRLLGWTEIAHQARAACLPAAALAALGVDVIADQGQFQRHPQFGFVVAGRCLCSRAYLLAPAIGAMVPAIPGLVESGYWTPQSFCQQVLQAPREAWPQQVVVVGGDPLGVALAQTLARLGLQVTMTVGSSHILPQDDPEAAALIQAQLEAEGVRILTRSRATQIRQIQAHRWVQAGDFALEAEAIILAAGQQLQVDDLNLAAVGVRCQSQGPELNARLQTTHPRIYGCRGAIAGYLTPHIARYEANLAVKNALFGPLHSADYQGWPRATLTHPELVRIGLTEPQAQQRYGKSLLVLRQSYKTNDKAQSLGATTGFCKLLVGPGGVLVGAHLVGLGASELSTPLALALRQRLRVDAIAQLPCLSPTLTDLLRETARGWQISRQAARRDWLEGYLNLTRGWFS